MDRIKRGCRELGLSYMDSVTNFISIDTEIENIRVVKALRDRGVRVSTPGYDATGTYIRASTGLPEDTDLFLSTLKDVLVEQLS